VPQREDVRDAICGCKLADLPEGAVVGTSSLRRAAQLRHFRPDLRVENIRGNVDTRLRKLDEGQFRAIMLAAAGLRRLSLESRIAELLDPELMCPAIGQGALAIETRVDDEETRRKLAFLDDATARAETTAERAMLAEIGGGCQVPVGGSARLNGSSLRLSGVVVSPDGANLIRVRVEGHRDEAAALGRRAAQELLGLGAGKILEQVYAP
jgi:hydroxymethylbilane synthase